MEDGFGASNVGNKAADASTVGAEGGLFASDNVGQVEAVGLVEGGVEQGTGDFEADVPKVVGRGEAALAELVDVEGELGLDVLVGALGIVDGGAVLPSKFREFDGDGLVGCVAVADGIADVVGEGADGEGEVVGGLGVTDETENEVSGADVVSEVGEERVAEGIVAKVLDGGAAVGVGVGFVELGVGEVGEVLEDDRDNGVLPGDVDDLLMRLDGVGVRLDGDE